MMGYGSALRRQPSMTLAETLADDSFCGSHCGVYNQIKTYRGIATKMLPPQAEKKMQCWIRSRHLICSGNFFIFETVESSALERFAECVKSLGGTLISVTSIDKRWVGNHRKLILYQAKASLHTPHHNLKQYWIKYGSSRTKFDPNC